MSDVLNRLASLSPEKRALVLRQLQAKSKASADNTTSQEYVTGDVPFMPLPRQYLAMAAAYGLNYHHFNVAALLEVERSLHPRLMEQVIQHLIRHHDALRLRIERTDNGWRQYIATPNPDEAIPLHLVDLSAVPVAQQEAALESSASEMQRSLNLAQGPILRFVYYTLGNQQLERLLIIVHHLAADEFSVRILAEDFATAYHQLSQGLTIQLPPKTTSLKERNERMLAYAQSPTIRQELAYWLSLPWHAVSPLPVDFPANLAARAIPRIIEIQFNADVTQLLLSSVPGPGGASVRDILLTALMRVLTDHSGSPTHLFTLLHSGRKTPFEDTDLSRTVGWLSVIPNALLQLPSSSIAEEQIRAVTQQVQRIPNDGIGYELLSRMSGDEAITKAFSEFPHPPIAFNYLGRRPAGGFFHPTTAPIGPLSQIPNLWKSSLQIINAEIVARRLHVRWEYSETVFQQTTIEQFIHQWQIALHALCAQ